LFHVHGVFIPLCEVLVAADEVGKRVRVVRVLLQRLFEQDLRLAVVVLQHLASRQPIQQHDGAAVLVIQLLEDEIGLLALGPARAMFTRAMASWVRVASSLIAIIAATSFWARSVR